MDTSTISTSSLSPEALQELILKCKLDELLDTLAPLTDTERKKLSKQAFTTYSVIRKKWFHQAIPKQHESLAARVHMFNIKQVLSKAQCAVLALCPLSKVKDIDQWVYRDDQEELIFSVLEARNPYWLKEWVDHQLESPQPISTWSLARKFVDTGLIDKPQSIHYVRAMAFHFNIWQSRTHKLPLPSLVERLIGLPDTFEDIYRLFEVESNAFTPHYLESSKNKPPNFQTWTTAIHLLCEQGYLDRGRVLDASLKGACSDFPDHQLSGFLKVHEHLKPTDKELTERQSAYVGLLNVRVSRVAGYALKKLSRLNRIKKLEPLQFLDRVSPIAELPTKGPVQSALKLTARILRQNPKLLSNALPLLHRSIQHESIDVQELACDILGTHFTLLSEDQRANFSDLASHFPPSIRARMHEVFDLEVMNLPVSSDLEVNDLDLILDELSSTEEASKKAFGLVGAHFLSQFPGPVSFDILDVSVLSTLDPIKPIKTLQELIDAVSHAIEIVDSADEVERILDGISRLCDQRPDDFSVQTASLLKQLKTPRYSESQRELIPGWGRLSLAFQDVLLTWLTGDFHDTSPPIYYEEQPHFLIQIRRLKELTRRVYKRDADHLFAAPTHEQGWIDPLQLVAKLRHLKENWKFNHKHDITQALLRIAPDRRQEALLVSSKLPDPIQKLVRWALGSNEGPTSKDKHEYELWVAAGRSRAPLEAHDETFKVFGIKDHLPDSTYPARYTWSSTLRHSSSSFSDVKYTFPEIQISHNREDLTNGSTSGKKTSMPGLGGVQKFLAKSFERLISLPAGPLWKRIPTTSLHFSKRSMYYQALSSWQINWMQYSWPLNTDSCIRIGINRMIGRIDENTASTIPLFSYIEPVFQLYRPWTELMRLAVWTALISKSSELQNFAIEAMIEAIADGRSHPEPMAEVLIKLSEGGWIKLNRLSHALEQVAVISELHKYVVCLILDRFIARLTRSSKKNIHHVLQLMLELHTALQLPVPPDTISTLKDIGGKGKAAQLAKKICGIKEEGLMTKTYVASIEGRLSLIGSISPSNQHETQEQ